MSAPVVSFRVEKGEPDLIEVGALAAVLHELRNDGASEEAARVPSTARWRRPERAPGFRNPRTWQEQPR